MVKLSNPVNLIIINDKKQILLARRTESEDGFKDSWSIPGGGSEPGETFEDALKREIKEELGVDIIWMRYFRSLFLELSEEHHARATYFYGMIHEDIRMNHELSDSRWFSYDEIELMNLAYNQNEIIRELITFIAGEIS